MKGCFMKKMKITKKGSLIFLAGLLTGALLLGGFQILSQPSTQKEVLQQEPKEPVEKDIDNKDTQQSAIDYPAWDKTAVYNGGDNVVFEDKIYKAKWWTQGETPGKSDVWEDTKQSPTKVEDTDTDDKKETVPVDLGDKKIVGYFPSWKPGKADMIRYDDLTDIVYAFAIPTADGGLRPLENGETAKQIIKEAHKNNVRVLIAVGGWSYQDVPLESTFMSATESSEKTKKFGDAILAMCDEYGFDGVDMDWEHPRVDGNSGKQYEELMLYLADKLHAQDKMVTSAVLSGATADGNVYYDAAAHSDAVLKAVDRIHVMAYDGGDGERHSTYEFALNCADYWSKTRHVDPNKIILGVPFYARPSWAAYGDIIKESKDAQNQDHTTYQGMDVYYNGLSTMKKKASYAKEHLGGIMIWELTQDSELEKYSLLKEIVNALK